MCGISGIIKNNISHEDRLDVEKMNMLLKSRGPDNSNVINGDNFVFGHTRLSIIDLSKYGNQPLFSRSKNFLISYNGEIYNHNELKKKLINEKKFNCVGYSDTEIFLNYIECYGLGKALQDARGMFAFSLYDKIKKKFFLARDKIGEKPLYYTVQNNQLVFSSQIKSIVSLNRVPKNLNDDALNTYFNYNYIQPPETIYKNIYQLTPGTYLELETKNFDKKIIKYFNIENTLKDNNSHISDLQNSINNVDQLLQKIVSEQAVADVNLGSFLSGGIDSSIVTAYLQKNSIKKIKTFNISYGDHNYNESKYANDVASILGTEHHTLEINDNMIKSQLHKLADIYDEPFADSSQIPTSLACSLASQNVKVCLSGDGGDEVFGGYNRHSFVKKYFLYLSKVDIKYRKKIKNILNKITLQNLEFLDKLENKKIVNFSNKFSKIRNIIDFKNLEDFYTKVTSNFSENKILKKKNTIKKFYFRNREVFENKNISNLQKSLIIDQSNYISDDIFTKVDRSSMHYSLEVRCPLADTRLLEYLNSCNDDLKITHSTKIILRELLKKFIPVRLINRPKMGFGIPINNLLKNSLKNLLFEKLSYENLKKSDVFNEKEVACLLSQHMNGQKDNSQVLWSILTFQLWYESNF